MKGRWCIDFVVVVVLVVVGAISEVNVLRRGEGNGMVSGLAKISPRFLARRTKVELKFHASGINDFLDASGIKYFWDASGT